MTYTYDVSDLQAQWDVIDGRFQRFVDYRGPEGKWAKLIRRDLPVKLQAELEQFREGFDYQSPLPEKYIFDHVDVLENPTWFNLNVLDQSDAGRDTQRALLLYTARSWDQENDAGWWDYATGEGKVRNGIDVTWLRWRPDKPAEGEKGRRDRKHPFYLEHCQIGGIRWEGSALDPDAVWYRYKLPVIEAGIKKDGKKLTLNNLGQIGWLGEGEDHDAATIKGKSIEIIVRDARDLAGRMCPCDGCDHVMRTITVLVCPEGKSLKESEEVQVEDSPFHHCSFFLTPARQSFQETDPHLQMRPMMAPVYALVYLENYIMNVLAAMARGDYSDLNLYESLATMGIQGVRIAREGGMTEGDKRSETDDLEIPIRQGQVLRLPKNISEHLLTMLQQVRQSIAECAPNRYLQGQADNVATNGTATMGINQVQAAGLPYNRLLRNSDRTIRRIKEAEFHAMVYWDYFEPEGLETRYVVSTTGGENVMRYRATIKLGEPVYIDAKMAKAALAGDIIVSTISETMAEQEHTWALAKDMKASGVFTTEDLMRAGRIFDVEGQHELLFREGTRNRLEVYVEQSVDDYILRLAETMTDMDYSVSLQKTYDKLHPPEGVADGEFAAATPTPQFDAASEKVFDMAGAAVGSPRGGDSPTGSGGGY